MGNVTSRWPEERNIICDCLHEESEHTFAGNCTKNYCKCTRYSQSKLRYKGMKLKIEEMIEIKKEFE